jgi:hypothetical protein
MSVGDTMLLLMLEFARAPRVLVTPETFELLAAENDLLQSTARAANRNASPVSKASAPNPNFPASNWTFARSSTRLSARSTGRAAAAEKIGT